MVFWVSITNESARDRGGVGTLEKGSLKKFLLSSVLKGKS